MSQLMRPAVAAYRSFDNPLGCQFAAGPIDLLDALDPTRGDMGYMGGGKRKVIGEGVIGTRKLPRSGMFRAYPRRCRVSLGRGVSGYRRLNLCL